MRSRRKAICLTAVLASLIKTTLAQQPGNWIKEVHPRLTTWKCTNANGCQPQNTSITIEARSRWLHVDGQSTSCFDVHRQVNETYCYDAENCFENCRYEGADYTSNGISTINTKDESTIRLGTNATRQLMSSRAYLLAEGEENYETIVLKPGMELTFDMDMSSALCGVYAALYLVQMDPTGGRSKYNTAAAPMGTGYCDAQCVLRDFVNGERNTNNSGSCCNEFDFIEGTRYYANASPHTCKMLGPYACTGTDCKHAQEGGLCSQHGCDMTVGADGFYGVQAVLDTLQPMTLVTQFLSESELGMAPVTPGQEQIVAVQRIFVQNGKVFNTNTVTGAPLILNDAICATSGEATVGGFAEVTRAMELGMTLTFSIFTYNAVGCVMGQDTGQGKDPALESFAAFSNVRWGERNSTWSASGTF